MPGSGAPPVTWPVGRTPRLAWLLAGLWLAGAGAVLGAFFPASVYHGALLAVSVALSGIACLMFWRGQAPRTLGWDGERWSLQPGDASDEMQARVRMDLQRLMLLRLEAPQGRAIWLWAEAGRDPARWHLLRCALYSPAPSVADVQMDESAA
jgi:hypothetical protein